MRSWKPVRSLAICGALLAFVASTAPAKEHTAAAKAWDQATVSSLAEQLAKDTQAAYKAIYAQGSTTGVVGSGQTRDYHRMRDKARVIEREARHLRAALKDGKGHDETLPIFERLMVDVRDIRVIGRRIMIQEMTTEKITAAGSTLREIAEYYDPNAFDKGSAPPLGNQ